MNKQLFSEQLEEGEIVDDDDLEDISDNSIIESSCGKFVSTNENLSALSLSSDNKKEILKYSKPKRKSLRCSKPRIKIQKKRKKRHVSIISSDSDSPQDDLKDKLKEAIHINGTDVNPKNSLETRLKIMSGLGNLDSATDSKPVEDNKTISDRTGVMDKVEIDEIEILRMEALRTAVLNRSKKRKRRKTVSENTSKDKPITTLENKENNTPTAENEIVKSIVNNDNTPLQTVMNVSEPDEDEDILRASLLAGLAKKLTNTQTVNNADNTKLTPANNLPMKPTVLPKKPMYSLRNNNVNSTTKRLSPQVKPLIITLNGDSDSDVEEVQDSPSKAKTKDLKVISNNVDKFLKEQRAKFEINVEKKIGTKKDIEKKSVLEKSVMKLLPRSMQIEYERLLKRLNNVELQRKKRKLTQTKQQLEMPIKISSNSAPKEPLSKDRPIEILPQPDIQKKINQPHNHVADINNRRQHNSNSRAEATKQKRVPSNELSTLQKILKDIRQQGNGSLQIKDKYQVLAPLVRKVTIASHERKKQDLHVKKLSKELNEARASLTKSHQNYSVLLKELIKKKEAVDKSGARTQASVKNMANGHSSTMLKKTLTTVSKDDSKGILPTLITSMPIKPPFDDTNLIKIAQTENLHNTCNNGYEDMDVCNSDDTDTFQVDIVDPNDIDQIFQKKRGLKSTVPEYISPLNANSVDRYSHVDPLGIMCPYEINGSCRDLECTFKHYLKNCPES